MTDAAGARTHCPYCAFQCAMHVESTAEGVAVRGDASFPVNRGQLCIKGFHAGALLEHPERLRQPLIRGQRGGGLAPCSWDEALDFTARRMLELRERHGADALGVFGSGALTNEKVYLLGKFARVALRTRNIDYNGRFCMASAAAGQNRAFGVDRGLPFPVEDIARTRTLLLWGANPADTMPPLMHWIGRQRDQGTLIVVDPRLTETARTAHIHLQPTPGTDLALANGMLHLAIDEGLVDMDYVRRRTTGFDEMLQAVRSIHPGHVERLTGISIERQLRVVRLLAAEASMLLSARGPEQQSKGSDTVLAFTNLMLCLGKVGLPNSGYGTLTGQGNGQGGREHGQKADQLPGYRSIEDAADRAAIAAVWGVDADAIPRKGKSAYELLDSLGPEGGVRSLLVVGSNVAVAAPNANHVLRRLRALDLLVVFDSFLNETAREAHVVLPTLQWAEEEGTLTNLEGRVVHRRPLRAPPPGPRGDLTILTDLAARMGEAARFPSACAADVFDEFRRATAGGRADYSGITYERIDREDGVFWPCPGDDHPGTPRLFADRFFHPDGRARLVPVRHRAAGEVPDAEYPLFFTTGRYREHYNSGAQTRHVGALVDARAVPKLELHPRLAKRLGVADGERLELESRRGRESFIVSFNDGIREDTLFAPFHWGDLGNANRLTNPALDPTSRMPEFKVCAVRARAAATGPVTLAGRGDA